ncbi:MAG: ABC transporter substrate-binding protein [Chloroflexi bacterium]|nr:ABC transporter substrate-binding protein [Chloroflexota bacterium]
MRQYVSARRRWLAYVGVILGVVLLAAACTPAAEPGPSPAPGATEPAGTSAPAKAKIRFGTLPILDAVPAHIAQQEGYFAAQNLEVEIVPFNSAVERDTALLAGRIDAGLNDLPSGLLLNKDGAKAKIVRIAMRATPQRAQYSILASPKASIASVADLKGKEIAISSNSVIEYVTDKLLQDAGLKQGEIKKTEVVAMPLRMQMLAEGQVAAAVLPEPLATLARNQGAKVVLSDQGTPYGHSVVLVSQQLVTQQPDAVKRFLAGWEQGVEAFNKEPNTYRQVMNEAARVPEPLRTTLTLPVYPTAGVPAADEVEAVGRWFVEKGVLKQVLPHAQVVDASFLPAGAAKQGQGGYDSAY